MKSYSLIFGLLLFISLQLSAQVKSNKIIKDYGIINDLEGVVKPKVDDTYKIVIDLKTKVESPSKVNRGLDNVARLLNLHAAGGISAENLHVAVAVHGNATPIILNDKGYRAKYGIKNPNAELIHQLTEAGVEIYICAQSLIGRKYGLQNVNEEVPIALSMLTVVTEKMNEGHHLMVFQ
jgi:intracellular sulfur oxidation DsrE/DsrF family protein